MQLKSAPPRTYVRTALAVCNITLLPEQRRLSFLSPPEQLEENVALSRIDACMNSSFQEIEEYKASLCSTALRKKIIEYHAKKGWGRGAEEAGDRGTRWL